MRQPRRPATRRSRGSAFVTGRALSELFTSVLGRGAQAGLVQVGTVHGTKVWDNASMTVNRTYEQIVREIRPWVASHTLGLAPSHESAWRSHTPAAHGGPAHDAPHHHRADRHHRVIAGQGDAPHRRLGQSSPSRSRWPPRSCFWRSATARTATAPATRRARTPRHCDHRPDGTRAEGRGPPRPASEARNRAMGHKPPAVPKHDRRITRAQRGECLEPGTGPRVPSGDRRRQAIRRAVDEPGRSRSPRRPRPGGRGRTVCVRRIDYLFRPGARSDGLPVVSRQLDAPDVPM
jgi:hypothetical protein